MAKRKEKEVILGEVNMYEVGGSCETVENEMASLEIKSDGADDITDKNSIVEFDNIVDLGGENIKLDLSSLG